MVTQDEAGELADIHVVTTLNGDVVQDQPDRRHDLPAGEDHRLHLRPSRRFPPGDVIATGTPGGVGAKRTPPLWMKAGDTVEIAIGPIGTLTNSVADEP